MKCNYVYVLLIVFWLSNAAYAGSSPVSPQGNHAHEQSHDYRATYMEMPPMGGFRKDPDSGGRVWRLGGNAAEMGRQVVYPNGNEAITLLHAQHFYSRTSPSNRAETYVLGSAGQNHGYAALWRLADKRLVAWVPAASSRHPHLQQRQLLWDKQDANVYWFTDGNRLIRASIDFRTYKTRTQTWDVFPEFTYITFGFGEGNFSDDGARVVLGGAAQDGSGIYIQPYEVKKRQKLPWRKVADTENGVDWASVDPDGHYILLARHQPEETIQKLAFSAAHTEPPHTILDEVKHGDFVRDAAGDSWWVYGNWRGLFTIRLRDMFSLRAWPVRDAGEADDPPEDFSASGHVARISGKPGWVLMSRYHDGGLYFVDVTGQQEPVYAGNSRHAQGVRPPAAADKKAIRRLGITHDSEVTAYKREARAAVSPSGRYVFFVSDYHSYAGQPNGYDPEPEPGKAYLNMIDLGTGH